MKINVKNNLPDDVEVQMVQTSDGSVTTIILSEAKLSETKSRILGDAKPGEVVKIGDREYIVLEHNDYKTSVITKEFVTKMGFGDSCDYKKSVIRKYVTGTFYAELCDVVGKENIYFHKVNLMCDDGSNKNDYVGDFVSILTTEEYRRYRELIPAYESWWTSTAVTNLNAGYSCDVCFVDDDGVVAWDDCDQAYYGVRPFCILNSSIPLSD